MEAWKIIKKNKIKLNSKMHEKCNNNLFQEIECEISLYVSKCKDFFCHKPRKYNEINPCTYFQDQIFQLLVIYRDSVSEMSLD